MSNLREIWRLKTKYAERVRMSDLEAGNLFTFEENGTRYFWLAESKVYHKNQTATINCKRVLKHWFPEIIGQ